MLSDFYRDMHLFTTLNPVVHILLLTHFLCSFPRGRQTGLVLLLAFSEDIFNADVANPLLLIIQQSVSANRIWDSQKTKFKVKG